jgi:hypothetical protein
MIMVILVNKPYVKKYFVAIYIMDHFLFCR